MTIEDLIGTEGIEVLLREELETAWLRGWTAGSRHAAEKFKHPCYYGPNSTTEREAADYAERVVGGSTRPRRPATLCAPSKDENAP
jgi:hypothetical protein